MATVYVPARNVSEVQEGAVPAATAAGVRFIRALPASTVAHTRPQLAVYEVGSGNYNFRSDYE